MITEYKVHLKNKTKDELMAFILQLQNLLDNKDRQIDLITEFLAGKDLGHYKREDGGEILGKYRLYNKNEWKEYFEQKAINNG